MEKSQYLPDGFAGRVVYYGFFRAGLPADAELLADLEDAVALIPERHDLTLD